MMRRLNAAERTLSVYALAQLGEIDRRKLYKDAGFHSMFAYCVGELGYSEPIACRRLQAADAARILPEALSLIRDGRLTIYSLALVSKHLTGRNSSEVLKRIEGKSVRDVERIVAELAPRSDTRDLIRSLPSSTRVAAPLPAQPSVVLPAAETSADTPLGKPTAFPISWRPQKIMPLSAERAMFSFTGSEELRRVFERCRDLMWHKFPDGRYEDVFLELGKHYLKLKDPELLPDSRPKAPRVVETRFIPRWIKSKVYRRDGGRCVYVSPEGRRCEARHSLEYDHILPWARGGRSDDPANIRLLCRAHNQWAAEKAGLS